MTITPNPALTVAICTINRLAFLRRAVDGALRQIEAFPKAQLWIIDNGSTDGTLDYLAGLAASSDRVHWAQEPRRGLYYARAAAIDRATGDFLVFLDDDASPREGWLRGLVDCLATDDSIGVVGCCADPEWPAAPPAWMSRRHFDALIATPIEGPVFETAFPGYPPGISFGLRLNGCAQLYTAPDRRNDYALGRLYGDVEAATPELLGGEETDLCEIYVRNGFRVMLAPHLRVSHHLPASRLTRDWFRRKFRGDGISRIRLMRLTGRSVLDRDGWPLLAAYPVLRLLHAVVRPLPYGKLSATLEALSAKAGGAWHELLHGPKLKPLPYRVDAASRAAGRRRAAVPQVSSRLFDLLPCRLSGALAAWKNYFCGEREIRELKHVVPSSGLSIDVGAHHGVYTYFLSRLSDRVVAYEPNPQLAEYLRRAVRSNVAVRDVALSDRSGTAFLSIPVVGGVAIPGRATVAERMDASHQTFDISLARLDDEGHRSVAFIKIDVEGKEEAVLRGGAETIRRDHPVLLIEIETRHQTRPMMEVFSMIEGMGYGGYFLCDGIWTPIAALGERLRARPHLADPNSRDYVANFLFWPKALGNPPW